MKAWRRLCGHATIFVVVVVASAVLVAVGVGLATATTTSVARSYMYDAGSALRVHAQRVNQIASAAPNGVVAEHPTASLDQGELAGGFSTFATGSPNAAEAAGAADHVVLGKSIGLEERAAKLGGRQLMGSADWQWEVLEAIANPNTKISVALDGLEGSGSAYSRVMAAVQRGASGAGSPLDWELAQLYQSGRLSTTGFFEGGSGISNPFG